MRDSTWCVTCWLVVSLDMRHSWSICDMTHWYVTWLVDMWHDLLICDMTRWYVTWLIDMWHDLLICDMTYWYVTWLIDMWHDSLICDMTHQQHLKCVRNISFVWMSLEMCHSYEWVIWLIYMTSQVLTTCCVAVCCSALQRVAVCCSVLQCDESYDISSADYSLY